MAQPGASNLVTVLTNIEVSLADSGFSKELTDELERRLRQVSGIRSMKRTEQSIILYPLSTPYIMSIQSDVAILVQECIEVDPSLNDKHVGVTLN